MRRDASVRLLVAAALFALPLPDARLAAEQTNEEDPFAAAIRPTAPLTPEEEQRSFRLPPGFQIQLVAAEPEIQKPMNLALDARGRLWVSGSNEYPFAAQGGQGNDAIKILEDHDGDGRADKITTFADGLNIPIGLYPWRRGVIAYSIPNLYYFEDTDGDDKADRRTVLFGPFDHTRDTHGMINSLRRGFDGWLYACHGWANESSVAGTDGHRIEMQGGSTFRMRLDGSRLERWTHGQVNPFGMAFDARGDLFNADCHTKPITLLVREGYYESFGKPHDGLGYVPPVMEHLHGSTAIAGVACYAADQFPAEYRGSLFTGNVMTSRVHRDVFRYHGSTAEAQEATDLVTSDDPWFRPVDFKVGPDGALYIADFYNRIIGHYEAPLDHPGRDRVRARIWRVSYAGDDPTATAPRMPDLSVASTTRLLRTLEHPNLTRRQLAADQLSDRVGIAAVPPLLALLGRVRNASGGDASIRAGVHALWILHRLGRLNSSTLEAVLGSESALLRTHSMQVLRETAPWDEKLRKLALAGLRDADPFVRRAAAEAVGAHAAFHHVQPLLELITSTAPADRHLEHVARIALRNQLLIPGSFARLGKLESAERRALASSALGIRTVEAADYLIEYVAAQPDDERGETLVGHAANYADEKSLARLVTLVHQTPELGGARGAELFAVLRQGYDERGLSPPDELRAWGLELVNAALAVGDVEKAAQSAAALTREQLPPRFVELLKDKNLEMAQRSAAASALATARGRPDEALLAALITEEALPAALRERICQSLADAETTATRPLLADVMRNAPSRVQLEAAQQLVVTREGAGLLFELLEDGTASPRLLKNDALRTSLLSGTSPAAAARVESLLATVKEDRTDRSALLAKRQKEFRDATPSADAGKEVFEKHCTPCHRMRLRGGLVGPNLDGIGTRGAERLIEDILDPNRNVDPAFRTRIYLLADGRVLSGLYRRRERGQVVLSDTQGKSLRFPAASVLQETISPISIMPNDWVDRLTAAELHDLLAHLLTPSPIPLSE